MISAHCTNRYTIRTGNAVYRHNVNARLTDTTQVNTLSNKNVMTVFPPDRSVKYNTFKNPCKGKNAAVMIINHLPRLRISSVVLYARGNTPDKIINITVSPTQSIAVNHISLLAFFFASSNLEAPRNCPMIMPTAFPMAINTTFSRLQIALDIFRPAITLSPFME